MPAPSAPDRGSRRAARSDENYCSEDSLMDISETGNAPAATSAKAKNTHATALTTAAEPTEGSANPARFAIIPASADANEFAIIWFVEIKALEMSCSPSLACAIIRFARCAQATPIPPPTRINASAMVIIDQTIRPMPASAIPPMTRVTPTRIERAAHLRSAEAVTKDAAVQDRARTALR